MKRSLERKRNWRLAFIVRGLQRLKSAVRSSNTTGYYSLRYLFVTELSVTERTTIVLVTTVTVVLAIRLSEWYNHYQKINVANDKILKRLNRHHHVPKMCNMIVHYSSSRVLCISRRELCTHPAMSVIALYITASYKTASQLTEIKHV